MLKDPYVKFQKRALSSTWKYKMLTKLSLSGFNPGAGTIYYNSESQISKWLKQPQRSCRDLNVSDHLVREVLAAAHDYLHVWSYKAIQNLMPRLGFGNVPVNEKNFEDFVFCHLLTETAAVVGLDYWYLAQIDLNQLLSIGTNVYCVSNNFHSSHLAEFQKFEPSFEILNQKFFHTILKMHLNPEYVGIEVKDLSRSPILFSWFAKELLMCEKQRVYTRQWLGHLSGAKVNLSHSKLADKVDFSARWKKELATELGQLLWNLVVDNKPLFFKPLKPLVNVNNYCDNNVFLDFRFFNLNSLGDHFWKKLQNKHVHPDSREFFLWQLLSKYDPALFDPELIEILLKLRLPEDLKSIEYLLRNNEEIKVSTAEIENLFFLN